MVAAVTIATLAVQALPSLINITEKIIDKLDDDDPNTGPVVELAEATHKALTQTIDDAKTVGSEVSNKLATAQAAADNLKSSIESAVKNVIHAPSHETKH